MKTFSMIVLLILTMLFAGCNTNHFQQNADRNNTLIVGIISKFSKMKFGNEKEDANGFDIDLANEIGKRLNLKIQFQYIDWLEEEELLEENKIDMLMSYLDITPERKQQMLFSKPYMDNHQVIICANRNDSENILNENDLVGKKIGVIIGSIAENYLDNNDKLKSDSILLFSESDEMFFYLYNNLIDLAICDEITIKNFLEINEVDFEALDIPIGTPTGIGIAFREDNTELQDKVQKALDEMIADGTAQSISEKWFGENLIKSY